MLEVYYAVGRENWRRESEKRRVDEGKMRGVTEREEKKLNQLRKESGGGKGKGISGGGTGEGISVRKA